MGFPPEVYSTELADAVEGTNTALAATAAVLSLERLKRGLKVEASNPHLYTEVVKLGGIGGQRLMLVPPTCFRESR